MKIFLSFFLVLAFFSCHQNSDVGSMKHSPSEKRQEKRSLLSTFDSIAPVQHVTSVPLPREVSFAGERVPLEKNDVREALEYELMVNTFRHSHTLLIIKKIERWRTFVLEILKEQNIPEDFIYLAVIESEFDNNARSFAGAVGMWQFMEKTAKDYDLKVNRDVDMRRDPKLATIAASKFLQWSYSHLNSWTLAAASYNMGMRGVQDRLKEQKVDNFYDLHVNPETSRYIFRILAFKLILENPEVYGYFVPDEEKYQPYQYSIKIIEEDIENLVDFAKQHNTTYKELRALNPWFNNTSNFKLNVRKKESYEIRIPLPKQVSFK